MQIVDKWIKSERSWIPLIDEGAGEFVAVGAESWCYKEPGGSSVKKYGVWFLVWADVEVNVYKDIMISLQSLLLLNIINIFLCNIFTWRILVGGEELEVIGRAFKIQLIKMIVHLHLKLGINFYECVTLFDRQWQKHQNDTYHFLGYHFLFQKFKNYL